jgi:hypothetical protein
MIIVTTSTLLSQGRMERTDCHDVESGATPRNSLKNDSCRQLLCYKIFTFTLNKPPSPDVVYTESLKAP